MAAGTAQPPAPKEMELVFIYWRDSATGCQGHGAAIPKSLAEQWIEYLNQKYPHMKHWLCAREDLG